VLWVLVPIDETGYDFYWNLYEKCEEAGVISMPLAEKWIGMDGNLVSVKNILGYLLGIV
jgi:hypothetical protein